MVSTHFKLGRPVVGKSTVVGNLYYPKMQKCNQHPRKPSLTITPEGPVSMWGLHLSCWIIGLTFMLLALCVSFMSSIAVIVHFKDFTTVLNSTHSAGFCPVLTDLWEKNKFYNRLLCLTTFTVSKFCAIWIRWLWKKMSPRATHWEASHTLPNPTQFRALTAPAEMLRHPLMNMQRQSFTYKRNWYSHYGLWLIKPPFTSLCFENLHQENVLLSKLSTKDLVPLQNDCLGASLLGSKDPSWASFCW